MCVYIFNLDSTSERKHILSPSITLLVTLPLCHEDGAKDVLQNVILWSQYSSYNQLLTTVVTCIGTTPDKDYQQDEEMGDVDSDPLPLNYWLSVDSGEDRGGQESLSVVVFSAEPTRPGRLAPNSWAHRWS